MTDPVPSNGCQHQRIESLDSYPPILTCLDCGTSLPYVEQPPSKDQLPEPSLDVLKRVRDRLKERGDEATELVAWAVEQIEEHDQSFDLRWKADMRAIKRWQAAHPGNDLTWPDHADLCMWLLEQLDARAAQPPPADQIAVTNPAYAEYLARRTQPPRNGQ